MELTIITPERKVFSGEAESVNLPGVEGRFQILNNHAAMICALGDGELRVKSGNEQLKFQIKSGIVEVVKNKISVLTEGVIE
ncbi:MAG: ATP synthase F1 subunit epsilon [Chitinophagales bacterium]|nr:ATP synthase F1 subunit epsilon [Chitinophagales bacterium]